MSIRSKLDVYPLESYLLTPSVEQQRSGRQQQQGQSSGAVITAGSKSTHEKLMSLKRRCRDEQLVHSVEGVLLVHQHRHPHVILLKVTTQTRLRDAGGVRVVPPTQMNSKVTYRLPGGRCRRGEREEACLLRKLGRQLLSEPKQAAGAEGAPVVGTSGSGVSAQASDAVVDVSRSKASDTFRVGEVLSRWYRPHFTPHMYPYVPPHISPATVKEERSLLLVHLNPTGYFEVQADRGVEVVAVPLFDLYENTNEYGPIIASLPACLSRVLLNYCGAE